MDKKLEVYWAETDKLLDEKMAEYEGVESMKAFYYFLKGAKLDNAFRAIDGRLDTGHLERTSLQGRGRSPLTRGSGRKEGVHGLHEQSVRSSARGRHQD